MINALQTLTDNGLSHRVLLVVIADIVENDDTDDIDGKRCLVALEWFLDKEGHCNPNACTFEGGEIVFIDSWGYRVLTDDEAEAACSERIVNSVWSFDADFLADKTGIDKSVFEALRDTCEDGNAAIRFIIVGTCGLASFVEDAIDVHGRGHFLAHYDHTENEVGGGWFVYRVN